MARELSQEAVLDFLWGAGGRAPNTALLRHFQRFLRDPALTEQQRQERREYFKSLVNSLATVRPAAAPGASKDIVLRRRYRDLLDEELPPPEEQEQREKEKDPPPPPRHDPDRRRGPCGEAGEKRRPGGGQPPGAAVAGGCSARGRGGPCCECRRALRAAAAAAPPPGAPAPAVPPHSRSQPPPPAQPPPYRTRPLSSGPWALHPDGPPRSRPPALPSGSGELTPIRPSRCRSPPPPPAGPPPYQTLQQPVVRPSQSPSPPLLPAGSAPFRSLPPREPPPTQSLPLPPGPGVLPPGRLLQPRSPPQPPAGTPLPKAPSPSGDPGEQPTIRPLQFSLLPWDPRVVSPTKPPPSRSLQPPLAEPPPFRSRPLLSAPGVLPLSRSLQALPSSSSPPPPLFPDNCRRQPRTMPSKSSPRNTAGRRLSVPLGQREHAWLVAVSEGRWARVRGLFLEEPELALQRDFMSGFTVLHWLAKHGDGPGLQELAVAARQAGLALDVDARSGCGYTPLHLAAIHGHQLVIKVLVLQLGCQVQIRDSSGRQPWEYLGSSTSGEIWQLLEAPRGTIMFPTQPLAHSVSSDSKVSLSAGRAALPACLRPQHGHQTSGKSN
ncbi:ankyrin repeat domain-containing protein SOWAHB [Indicator indicator]|uniref:ankyrin repeat domain-containing protein SOWAHB n=1 Tax=Indicator indicator TaxID=1002788 RepID=UPI0023DEFC2F|nr:ankyrin repeat domain-containing protein SOWAHB [Indicator indicator]